MSKPEKIRLDQLLVDRGLVENRTRAQAVVMAGLVFSETKRLDKPGHKVAADIPLTLKGPDHPWVSRGGVKLSHGLGHFGIDPDGRTCLDIGASTGGFTDVLLQGGAARVYAVDVGHGQLDWKLSQDDRVRVLDKTNARHLTGNQVPDPVKRAVLSLFRVWPPLRLLVPPLISIPPLALVVLTSVMAPPVKVSRPLIFRMPGPPLTPPLKVMVSVSASVVSLLKLAVPPLIRVSPTS